MENQYVFPIVNNAKQACYVETLSPIGAGNNPMVGMTVAVAVAVEQAN